MKIKWPSKTGDLFGSGLFVSKCVSTSSNSLTFCFLDSGSLFSVLLFLFSWLVSFHYVSLTNNNQTVDIMVENCVSKISSSLESLVSSSEECFIFRKSYEMRWNFANPKFASEICILSRLFYFVICISSTMSAAGNNVKNGLFEGEISDCYHLHCDPCTANCLIFQYYSLNRFC